MDVDVRALYAEGYYADVSSDMDAITTASLHLPGTLNSSSKPFTNSAKPQQSRHISSTSNSMANASDAGVAHTATSNALVSNSSSDNAEKHLIGVTVFAFNKSGGFVKVGEAENGHVCSGEAYVFLCVYKEGSEEGEEESVYDEDDEQSKGLDDVHEEVGDERALGRKSSDTAGETAPVAPPRPPNPFSTPPPPISSLRKPSMPSTLRTKKRNNLTCNIYFWQGLRASKLAYTSFRFRAQPELENLVREVYGCPVYVSHVDQCREPIEVMLGVWGGVSVVHIGKREGLKENVEIARGCEVQIGDLRVNAASRDEEDSVDTDDGDGEDDGQSTDGSIIDDILNNGGIEGPATPPRRSPSVTSPRRLQTFSSPVPSPTRAIATKPPYRIHHSVLFHIRTEKPLGIVRAVQIPATSEHLISRDCFFVYPTEIEIEDITSPFSPFSRTRGFLWVGKNATRDEVRKAHEVASRIMEIYDPHHANGSSSSLDSASSPSRPSGIERRYRILTEGLEPKLFWDHFEDGKKSTYAGGPPPPPSPSVLSGLGSGSSSPSRSRHGSFAMASPIVSSGAYMASHVANSSFGSHASITERMSMSPLSAVPQPIPPASTPLLFQTTRRYMPRFLTCSCSKGYFVVAEIPGIYLQKDLKTDSCAIVDAGSGGTCFVWFGKHASDVVRKLTKKAVEVWMESVDDGRRYGTPSFDYELEAKQKKMLLQHGWGKDRDDVDGAGYCEEKRSRSDVVFVEEGREGLEFKSMFHGWDDKYLTEGLGLRDDEPLNQYLREQKALKETKRKMKAISIASSSGQAEQLDSVKAE
jgi:hypothetical protein